MTSNVLHAMSGYANSEPIEASAAAGFSAIWTATQTFTVPDTLVCLPDTEVFDTAGFYNTATGVFTVPSVYDGYYAYISANVEISNEVRLSLDLELDTGGGFSTITRCTRLTDRHATLHKLVKLADGDEYRTTIELFAGASQDVQALPHCFFSALILEDV